MGRDHVEQTLDSMLTRSTQNNPDILTEGMEVEVKQDVAADLGVFIQLAKVGHYDRAMPFFDEYLTPHSRLFPVAAEYADCLLEQGAFGQADVFLYGTLKSEATSGMERTVLELLSAIASMHTSLSYRKSIMLACDFLENRDPLTGLFGDKELQATVLCFRIFHEATRDSVPNIIRPHLTASMRLAESLEKIIPGGCQDSKLFQKIATSGQVWLAQKLLEAKSPRSFGTKDRESWDEAKLLRDVMSSLQIIPGGDTPPAILAKIGFFANYCQQLLADSKKSRFMPWTSLPQALEFHLQLLRESASRGFLSTIDTRIEETRQFKHAQYAVKCLEQDTAPAQPFIGEHRDDYAMTALAQASLARFEHFQDLDLDSAWRLFRRNRDKLGWLRLLAVLQPFSETAKEAVLAWDSCEWGDDAIVAKIGSELKGKGKARLEDQRPPAARTEGFAAGIGGVAAFTLASAALGVGGLLTPGVLGTGAVVAGSYGVKAGIDALAARMRSDSSKSRSAEDKRLRGEEARRTAHMLHVIEATNQRD